MIHEHSHIPTSLLESRRRAFTMLEVLLAMGVLAIGMVMVATIFPVAALLQKRTVDDVLAQQAARNTENLIRGRLLSHGELVVQMAVDHGTSWQTDQRVYPFPQIMLQVGTTPPMRWTPADRSFPSTVLNVEERRYYWIPLVQDFNSDPGTAPADCAWRLYVFVMRRQERVNYPDTLVTGANVVPANPDDADRFPKVFKIPVSMSGTDTFEFSNTGFNQDGDGDGIPDYIAPGDTVLDSNGVVHSVVDADVNGFQVSGMIGMFPNPVTSIWFAPPGINEDDNTRRRGSPLVRIIPLPDGGNTEPLVAP